MKKYIRYLLFLGIMTAGLPLHADSIQSQIDADDREKQRVQDDRLEKQRVEDAVQAQQREKERIERRIQDDARLRRKIDDARYDQMMWDKQHGR